MHRLTLLACVALALLLSACGGDDENAAGGSSGEELTIYSGRNEDLVGELIERFERETGVRTEVRYADSPELAATLVEEGDNSPADVFFSQDAGALGALQQEGLLRSLPRDVLDRVDRRFRSAEGDWVGTSGRVRVIAYDKRRLQRDDLPDSVLDLTDERWRGKVGWAPTNASFQTFVTALRLTRGQAAAKRWLEHMQANDVQRYENNIAIRDAIANGEIELGIINHYYVAEAVAEEGEDYPVGIFGPDGDIGSLVNVAGVGVLKGMERETQALRFARFLLSPEAQRYFAERTKEYPLIDGVPGPEGVVPLEEVRGPDVDLNRLDDLKGTVDLLTELEAL